MTPEHIGIVITFCCVLALTLHIDQTPQEDHEILKAAFDVQDRHA